MFQVRQTGSDPYLDVFLLGDCFGDDVCENFEGKFTWANLLVSGLVDWD